MEHIFCNEEWEAVSENGQVVLCGFYHRYWNPDRTRNQAFDMFSGRILDVKDKKEKGISYFFQQLDEGMQKDSAGTWGGACSYAGVGAVRLMDFDLLVLFGDRFRRGR